MFNYINSIATYPFYVNIENGYNKVKDYNDYRGVYYKSKHVFLERLSCFYFKM